MDEDHPATQGSSAPGPAGGEPGRAGAGGPAAPPRPPARTRRRGPGLMMILAIILSVPILILTFTKEKAPEDPVTMSDLRKHFGWRGAVLSLMDTLKRQFPQDFAGSELGTDELHSGWVGFKAGVPSGAEAFLAQFRADPRNGTIEVVENLGFNATDLSNRVEAARSATADLDGVTEATVTGEERTGVLVVRFGADTDLGADGFRDAVLDALGDRLGIRVVPWTDGAKAGTDVVPVRLESGPADGSAAPSPAPIG